MKKININDAPILEWDDDAATESKNYFFAQGKKPFENFKKVQTLGINKCIIFFPRDFEKCTSIYKKCEKIYEFKSASSISPIYLYDKKLLIALCPLGGPASANLIEELEYIGIDIFIACGSCGCLSEELDITNLFFVPDNAIRDEGLSYHYLPASRLVNTNAKINKLLAQVLKKHDKPYVKGTVWTIDSMYRETPKRIARRKQEGAIGVDMECASLASVAKYNNLEFGSLFYFTDTIGSSSWKWRIYDKIQIRTQLLEICIEALCLL